VRERAWFAARDPRGAHGAQLGVDAERLGQAAQRGEVLGHRRRRAPRALERVAVGAHRFGGELLGAGVRAQERGEAAVDGGVVCGER
jgi:hypothetical protein